MGYVQYQAYCNHYIGQFVFHSIFLLSLTYLNAKLCFMLQTYVNILIFYVEKLTKSVCSAISLSSCTTMRKGK